MNTSFFGELLQSISDRGRALLDRARERRGERRSASESLDRTVRASAVGPRRGLRRRAGARNPRPLCRTDHRAAHRLLRGAGAALRRPTARAHGSGASPPGGGSRPTKPPRKCMPPPSRAGRNCSAGSISRPSGTAALVRMREQLIDVLDHRDDLGGGRCRFRASVLVLVQPRLPGAAAHRLVDAGDHPGEDHPLRGGA